MEVKPVTTPPLPQKEAAALSDFAHRVRTALGDQLVELRLFGSRARGDAGPHSDIDVLVIVNGKSERWRLATAVSEVAFDVNLDHDVFISPVIVSETVVRDPVWRETPFARSAYGNGVAL